MVLTKAGITPDPWQAELLLNFHSHVMLLAGRQCGKSLAAAAMALRLALRIPESVILILSPSERQSKLLLSEHIQRLWRANGVPWDCHNADLALSLKLGNGSKIIALPDNPKGFRGYHNVAMLIIDEAAQVSDETYHSALPFLATSRGQLLALSTPFGQRGWFYEAWMAPDIPGMEPWHRVKAPATQCPRITKAKLLSERQRLGKKWYSMEYELVFLGMAGAVFDPEDIEAARRPNLQAVPFD